MPCGASCFYDLTKREGPLLSSDMTMTLSASSRCHCRGRISGKRAGRRLFPCRDGSISPGRWIASSCRWKWPSSCGIRWERPERCNRGRGGSWRMPMHLTPSPCGSRHNRVHSHSACRRRGTLPSAVPCSTFHGLLGYEDYSTVVFRLSLLIGFHGRRQKLPKKVAFFITAAERRTANVRWNSLGCYLHPPW